MSIFRHSSWLHKPCQIILALFCIRQTKSPWFYRRNDTRQIYALYQQTLQHQCHVHLFFFCEGLTFISAFNLYLIISVSMTLFIIVINIYRFLPSLKTCLFPLAYRNRNRNRIRMNILNQECKDSLVPFPHLTEEPSYKEQIKLYLK